jgi:hypothetical protein
VLATDGEAAFTCSIDGTSSHAVLLQHEIVIQEL